MNAIAFLNGILASDKIEGAAADSHNKGWFASKQADETNPDNPFRGHGPTRVRVGDLSGDQRAEYDISDDVDGGKDVFHPLYMPFADLDADTVNKNASPLAAVCYAFGDTMIEDDTTVEQLGAVLETLINGSNTAGAKFVGDFTHCAFQCHEIRVGSRAYGDNARDDFPLRRSLSNDLAALDDYTTKPAAEWLRAQVTAFCATNKS